MGLYLRTGGFGRSFKDMVGNLAGLAGVGDPFRVRLSHRALPYLPLEQSQEVWIEGVGCYNNQLIWKTDHCVVDGGGKKEKRKLSSTFSLWSPSPVGPDVCVGEEFNFPIQSTKREIG